MADPVADAPAIDEFAQTRGGDDLFDDEIIPVPAAVEQVQLEVQVPEENAATLETDVQPTRTDTPPRSRGGERRGRGRGKGGRGRRGSQSSGQRRAEGGSRTKSVDTTSQPESTSVDDSAREASVENTEQPSNEDNPTSPTAETKAAAGAEAPKVPAVRGDRSATGGIKKPKLTDEELSRRIAAAKENAARKAAAHARAEADQASFLEREKVAEAQRRQERANRRVMDSERERNRLRKLQAVTGREWDAEKQEEADSSRGGRGRFRGMHGGVSGYARRDFETSQPDEESSNGHSHYNNNRGRGRGGRGGRGRGSAREPRADAPPSDASSKKPVAGLNDSIYAPRPVVDNETEFPALPAGEKKSSKTEAAPAPAPTPAAATVPAPPTVTAPAPDAAKIEASISPVSATGATWADQVELNE